MIPFGFRGFRTPPTDLYLNGPVLEINSQPISSISVVGGSTTFVVKVKVFYENGRAGAVADGVIKYQWYDQSGELSDNAKISGSKSNSLTVTNIQSPSDDGRNFYVKITYTPGGYNNTKEDYYYYFPFKTSGSALNSPLLSNTGTLTVVPIITITTQPVSQTIAEGQTVTFTAAASTSDPSKSLQYYWTVDGIIQPNSNSTSISLTKSSIGTEKVQFHAYTTICPSGSDTGGRVTCKNYITSSNEVDFIGVAPRNIVKFEVFAADNSYSSQEVNLDDGDFTLLDTVFGTNYNIITFYAKEKDIPLELTLKASKGSNRGSFNGGEGGVSTISLTLDEKTEYTILGISNNSAVFLYKGSELYAVVGQGGSAGISGNGGNGGGVGLAGVNASGGSDPGAGGPTDSLSLNGIFGSTLSSVTLQSGDSLATSPDGGRTISCTKGSYWIQQGISPCSNNSTSNIKFVNTDGTEITSSDEIIRGFKPGYTITTTAGKGVDTPSVDSGNGGNGASGGDGGTNGSGGGGGSGYTGGSVQVISTSSGGNSSTKSSVVFSV
jgi:hypothetical protein